MPFPCARFTVSAAVAALAVSAEPEEDETSEDTVSEEDEAPEEDAFEDEEQWLPLQQPQVDERQAQEVLQRAQSVPDEELGAYPGMRYGAKAA